MPSNCFVTNCKRDKLIRVAYHRFPNEEDRNKQWISLCGREDIKISQAKGARICSRHFDVDAYERDFQHELLNLPVRKILKIDAVPTLNLPGQILNENTSESQSETCSQSQIKMEYHVPTIDDRENFSQNSDDLIQSQSSSQIKEECPSPTTENRNSLSQDSSNLSASSCQIKEECHSPITANSIEESGRSNVHVYIKSEPPFEFYSESNTTNQFYEESNQKDVISDVKTELFETEPVEEITSNECNEESHQSDVLKYNRTETSSEIPVVENSTPSESKTERRRLQKQREKQRIAMREQIIELHRDGNSKAAIARKLKLGIKTVNRWVSRYEEKGNVFRRPSGAPPRRTTLAEDLKIMAACEEAPFCHATEISAQLGLQCSINTIRRRLYQRGWHGQISAEGTLITNEHPQARLQFCQEYQHMDMDFWKRVIFTDQRMFRSNGQGWTTIPSSESANISHSERSRRVTVGFWGWFSFYGPGELIEFGEDLNDIGYLTILDALVSSARVMQFPEPEPLYVVHEQSPIHMSQVIRKWQAHHPNVHFLPWPPKGTDLNPIENLWDLMTTNWDMKKQPSKQNLVSHCQFIWDGLRGKVVLLENLVKSMPCRIQKCIEAGGDFINY